MRRSRVTKPVKDRLFPLRRPSSEGIPNGMCQERDAFKASGLDDGLAFAKARLTGYSSFFSLLFVCLLPIAWFHPHEFLEGHSKRTVNLAHLARRYLVPARRWVIRWSPGMWIRGVGHLDAASLPCTNCLPGTTQTERDRRSRPMVIRPVMSRRSSLPRFLPPHST